MIKQENLRNIAIIAHVDHGKTTLVDALLKQTRMHRNIEEMGECIMDSMDLERERGITIRAKNVSVNYKGVKINVVDTPGHADFGGEVERILRMVDGVLILVDAKDGPMPQTRFVLRKALELGLKAIVVVNKVDLPDAQVDDVVNRTFDLFVELNATDKQLDFPIVYASAIQGTATLDMHHVSDNIFPLLDTILKKIEPPTVDPEAPLQILILALLGDYYKGKMGIGKITGGSMKVGSNAALVRKDGSKEVSKVTAILTYEGLERVERESAVAGEIVAVAGFDDVSIGDTITDPVNPTPLTPPDIDEPTVQMTFGVNTSPFAGREGKFVTSRNIRDRLMKETETNVSLRVSETSASDAFLVSGRGELHLAILVEQMRREGFELQVSQPEVIYHEKDGVKCEPYEFLTVEVPAEYQGSVIEELGRRKGKLKHVSQSATGSLHLEYQISTRGIIGLKGAMMTKTRGMAVINHVFDEYKPVESGAFNVEPRGSLVAIEPGVSTAYAIENAQQRGEMFIGPNVDVYEGMIVGENPRGEDMPLSPVKTKKLTNMRSSTSDIAVVLTPPRELTLELAIEYIGSDELVEVTPKSIRLRKRILNTLARKRADRDKDKE